MVTNQNRLTAYFGFFFNFKYCKVAPFAIEYYRILKCLKRIVL